METKKVPSQLFLCVAEDVTCDKLPDFAQRAIPGLRDAFEAAGFTCVGGMQIICPYSKEAHEPWHVIIGMPVEGEKAVNAPYFLWRSPEYQCVWHEHVGPISSIKDGWAKIWGEIRQHGISTTSEWREEYKNWEGPDSPANVIELQVGVP